MDNTKRLNLTITALKQSLGKKIADAEEEIATIRAEASLLLEENAERITELEQENSKKNEEIESLKQKVRELEGEGDVAVSSEAV
jgi:predicted nuclease with TOPRIM domain